MVNGDGDRSGFSVVETGTNQRQADTGHADNAPLAGFVSPTPHRRHKAARRSQPAAPATTTIPASFLATVRDRQREHHLNPDPRDPQLIEQLDGVAVESLHRRLLPLSLRVVRAFGHSVRSQRPGPLEPSMPQPNRTQSMHEHYPVLAALETG